MKVKGISHREHRIHRENENRGVQWFFSVTSVASMFVMSTREF